MATKLLLSEAALCTYEQGPKYFRKLTAVFLTKEDWTEDDIHQAVQQSGANTDQFKSCFFKRTYEKLLNQHLAYSTSVGVTAPPTILVDGEPLEGAISRGELRELVRRRIESKSPAWRAFIRRLKYYFKN